MQRNSEKEQSQTLAFFGLIFLIIAGVFVWINNGERRELIERTKSAVCSEENKGETVNAEGLKVQCD